MHNDRLLVVIPTLDEAANIENVIRTLESEKPLLPELEIVIVDGGSQDGTTTIANRLAMEVPFVHLMHNPRRNQGAAVNLAARHWARRADVMIRCDAHALYPDRYIERLLQTLNATRAASIVVCMDSLGQTCFQKAAAWVSDTFIGSGGSAHRGGRISGFVDHGHHAAFQLATFLAVGGYDESFTHNEDAELDCRLTAAGYSIYLDAGVRITYYPRAGAAALWRQYFHYGRGRSRTMRRHPGSVRLRQLAVPGACASPLIIRAGGNRVSLLVVSGVAGNLSVDIGAGFALPRRPPTLFMRSVGRHRCRNYAHCLGCRFSCSPACSSSGNTAGCWSPALPQDLTQLNSCWPCGPPK